MTDTEYASVSPGTGSAGRRPVLAGSLLVTAGLLDIVTDPITASTDPYVVLTDQGFYLLDVRGWMWFDLVIAAATTLTGLLVLANRRWTTLIGIGCAGLAVVIDGLLIPFVPLRATLAIGLGVAAIWMLVRHRRSRPSG